MSWHLPLFAPSAPPRSEASTPESTCREEEGRAGIAPGISKAAAAVAAASASDAPAVTAPTQWSIGDGPANSNSGVGNAVAAVTLLAKTVAGEPLPNTGAEAVSGPHLRTTVVVMCISFWLFSRQWSWWAPQLTMFPLVALGTTATSALWCTPHELILSLGPVPVCIFRRRFPYRDIASVTLVQGRRQVLKALLRSGFHAWEFFGFIYGLTIGKALIDVALEPDSPSRKALGRWGGRLLISVDEAEDVVELVLFRKQYGSEAPLPPALAALKPTPSSSSAKWVWCDICDYLCPSEPWKEDKVMCNMWDLLLQPWRQTEMSSAMSQSNKRRNV